MSIPIIVTDENNRVLFKNVTAGKAFSGVRLNSYISTYFMYKSDADVLDSFCDENIPIVLTVNLVGYTMCCLVIQKEIDGVRYRFYTVAPLLYELFEKRSDDMETKRFLHDFEEQLSSHIRYMNNRLDGCDEKISGQIKGRIRAGAGRILYYGDLLRKALGVSGETLSRVQTYQRKMNIVDSVSTLVKVFNEIDTKNGEIKLEYSNTLPRILTNINSVAFGRLFTYTAFINLKYSFTSPKVTITYKDGTAYINFIISSSSQRDTELFELDLGYLKAYAERSGMTLDIGSCGSQRTLMYIKIDNVETSGLSGLSAWIEPYGDYKSEIQEYYSEISKMLSLYDFQS